MFDHQSVTRAVISALVFTEAEKKIKSKKEKTKERRERWLNSEFVVRIRIPRVAGYTVVFPISKFTII